jgi:GNAT superfamily N-acetyltransferase
MSDEFTVVRQPDAVTFLRRAGTWLMRAEAEHNLILGVADRLALGDRTGFRGPIYIATVERAGGLVGCAFRTPPFPVGVTRMPAGALPALLDDLQTVYDDLLGVLGPEETAEAMAEVWTARGSGRARLLTRQTIYVLGTLQDPGPLPPGRLRVASGAADTRLAEEWMGAFLAELEVAAADARERAAALVLAGDLCLWEDEGAPRAMAAVAARTPHGARIGFVYTPPRERGKGYGTAVSAGLTGRLLGAGARFCYLYADKANATSNAIYRRLGYEPVADVADWRFEGEGSGPAGLEGKGGRGGRGEARENDPDG